MDKGVNIPRSSRRKKEETTYSEGEGDNGTEEEGDDTSGTYTRSQDKLLDVMMEQQTKQLQQQTLQWEQRFEAEREHQEQMWKEKEWQEDQLKKERDTGDAFERRVEINGREMTET